MFGLDVRLPGTENVLGGAGLVGAGFRDPNPALFASGAEYNMSEKSDEHVTIPESCLRG